MKKILIVYGGFEFHEPYKTVCLFLPFLRENGFNVDICSHIKIYSDYKKLRKYDVILQNYGEKKITQEQEKGLLSAVAAGTGLIGFHAGLCDTFRDSFPYKHMVGGQFIFHPEIKRFRVIIDSKSKLLNGIRNFYIKTELYHLHFSPEINIHAWTVIEKKIKMPVVWTKKYGRGRIFYCSLGHDTKDFEEKGFFEIMKRGIMWVANNRYITNAAL